RRRRPLLSSGGRRVRDAQGGGERRVRYCPGSEGTTSRECDENCNGSVVCRKAANKGPVVSGRRALCRFWRALGRCNFSRSPPLVPTIGFFLTTFRQVDSVHTCMRAYWGDDRNATVQNPQRSAHA